MLEFDEWLKDLDKEATRRGYVGGLVTLTGSDCWVEYYKYGYTPSDALDEDESYL